MWKEAALKSHRGSIAVDKWVVACLSEGVCIWRGAGEGCAPVAARPGDLGKSTGFVQGMMLDLCCAILDIRERCCVSHMPREQLSKRMGSCSNNSILLPLIDNVFVHRDASDAIVPCTVERFADDMTLASCFAGSVAGRALSLSRRYEGGPAICYGSHIIGSQRTITVPLTLAASDQSRFAYALFCELIRVAMCDSRIDGHVERKMRPLVEELGALSLLRCINAIPSLEDGSGVQQWRYALAGNGSFCLLSHVADVAVGWILGERYESGYLRESALGDQSREPV